MNKELHDKEIMNQMKGFSIPWERSQEEVWKALDPGEQAPRNKVVHLRSRTAMRSVAAVLVLLLATGLFMRFFERHLESAPGEHLTHQLPDGSVVEMNAGSILAYHPYWWRMNRKIRFEGEGFFMVQKGKAFQVESPLGTVQVLGTSFSIYARAAGYRVVCHTGSVQVTAMNSLDTKVLSPNQTAELEPDGALEISMKIELPEPAPWKSGLFEFTSEPLVGVLNEIERQYGIVLIFPENLDYRYTGEFNANRDLLTTLNLVCRPFGITFARNAAGEYQLIENPAKD